MINFSQFVISYIFFRFHSISANFPHFELISVIFHQVPSFPIKFRHFPSSFVIFHQVLSFSIKFCHFPSSSVILNHFVLICIHSIHFKSVLHHSPWILPFCIQQNVTSEWNKGGKSEQLINPLKTTNLSYFNLLFSGG